MVPVRAERSDRDGLEHIARYLARPPVATERLTPLADGLVALRFKRPFSDGTEAVGFTPFELIERLLPLIPRPRKHTIRFHGILAPAAGYRAKVVLAATAPEPPRSTSRLLMEGLAVTGAWVDKEQGLLSLIVLEMGGSSRLCMSLQPGEPVVVMGPTGTRTETPGGESVILAGGGLGNAVLFFIGGALRAQGSRVLNFAAYRQREDIYKIDEIEAAADQIVWSVDGGELPDPRRPQDRAFSGNVVQAMGAQARGELGETLVPLPECHRIIAIGSDRMMKAVKDARHGLLAQHFRPGHVAIASINSPMQCMMKEICARCLQRHIDPATGKETIVFSCSNQDQPQDFVDWKNLADRLRQEHRAGKLTDLWVRRLLTHPEA